VTLKTLESELPNGLHDALLHSIVFDIVCQSAEFVLDIWVGNTDSSVEAEREAYRRAMLKLTGLAYLVIEPPGPGCSPLSASPVRIDTSEPDPTLQIARVALAPGIAGRFFVSEWNCFIHFAARDVSLQWTTD
jgi:hypothetical protein